MGRVSLAITLVVVGAFVVGAFFSGVRDDPCEDSDAGTAAVLIALLLFGVASSLIASRLTTRAWVPVVATITTVVVGYFTVTTVALLVYWVPTCAN